MVIGLKNSSILCHNLHGLYAKVNFNLQVKGTIITVSPKIILEESYWNEHF